MAILNDTNSIAGDWGLLHDFIATSCVVRCGVAIAPYPACVPLSKHADTILTLPSFRGAPTASTALKCLLLDGSLGKTQIHDVLNRRDFRSYRAIKKSLQSFRPDVVHTHSGKAGLLGRQAAASLDHLLLSRRLSQ